METRDDSAAPSESQADGASISGTIEFQGVTAPTPNVTVHVRVQDTSRADARARTVAEQVLRGVNVAPGSPPLSFTVRGIPLDQRARYSVRVHADVNGNGVVSRGDYVSTESHPVHTSESSASLSIVARPVR